MLSHSVVSDSVTLWTVAHQPPLPWDFSSKNIGVGCHFLLQDDFPNPGIEPTSPALQVDSLPLSHWGSSKCYIHVSNLIPMRWHSDFLRMPHIPGSSLKLCA